MVLDRFAVWASWNSNGEYLEYTVPKGKKLYAREGPAKKSQSRYFEQGEIFPKIENNDWGETIWYLEITNKLQ